MIFGAGSACQLLRIKDAAGWLHCQMSAQRVAMQMNNQLVFRNLQSIAGVVTRARLFHDPLA